MKQIKLEEQIGGVILSLNGQFIGGQETDDLKKTLEKIAEEKRSKLIIDMKKVTYLNSTALGVLIAANSNFLKREGKIILCNLGESIENVFMITKLSLVFEIADDFEVAKKMYKNK